MPLYNYTGLNKFGKTIRGCISAANELDLEERLKGIEVDLLDSKEAKPSRFNVGAGAGIKELILICIQLEQLERAGVPILEAVADLRDSAESLKLKNLLAEIYEDVKGGNMLSEAMAKHRAVFSEVFTGLVAAGEQTGNLHDTFSHLAAHLKWTHEIRNKVKKATYYPIFMLLMMVGIVSLMMLFVIPKLASFLKAQSFDLPIYTKALMNFSDFFVNYWYVLILGPIILIFIFTTLLRVSYNFSYNWDGLKLKMPVLGSTIRKIEIARFCRFFAITYRSGIGILDCLDIANNVVQNKVLKETVEMVSKSVSDGGSLTNSLRSTDQFPSLVIRMFKVGEDSGNLDTALENINFFYDREVNDAVNGMVAVIQPVLTMVLGAIMMWVSMAVFGPLYGSFSKMNF